MKIKKLYKVFGIIPYVYDTEKRIDEYVYAYSLSQALKIVAIRLKKRHPCLNIDLSECEVIEVEKNKKS